MRIAITYSLDDRVRRAISHLTGNRRPATREECEQWLNMTINSTLAEVCAGKVEFKTVPADNGRERMQNDRPTDRTKPAIEGLH